MQLDREDRRWGGTEDSCQQDREYRQWGGTEDSCQQDREQKRELQEDNGLHPELGSNMTPKELTESATTDRETINHAV